MADDIEPLYCGTCFSPIDVLSNPQEIQCSTCGKHIQHEEDCLTVEQLAAARARTQGEMDAARRDGLIK